MVPQAALIAAGFASGLLLEWLILRTVARPTLLATPNERSSHSVPTPTMGGAAIALIVLVYLGARAVFDESLALVQLPLLLAGSALLATALLGLADDLVGLRRRSRFLVQTLAAGAILVALDGMGLAVFSGVGLAAWVGLDAGVLYWLMCGVVALVLLVGLVWFTNLYNFMDGIDGLAGVQCLAFCLGCQLLSGGVPGWAGDLLWITAAVTLAFLCFNWSPARIFMGDVGSGFIGLLVGFQVLYLWLSDVVPLSVSLILLAGFWFDATYTLLVRVGTGQRFTEAHRSHAYQRLADRYGHARTSLGFALFVGLWLLPLCWASFTFPGFAAICLTISILPIGVLCIRYRAGLIES